MAVAAVETGATAIEVAETAMRKVEAATKVMSMAVEAMKVVMSAMEVEAAAMELAWAAIAETMIASPRAATTHLASRAGPYADPDPNEPHPVVARSKRCRVDLAVMPRKVHAFHVLAE